MNISNKMIIFCQDRLRFDERIDERCGCAPILEHILHPFVTSASPLHRDKGERRSHEKVFVDRGNIILSRNFHYFEADSVFWKITKSFSRERNERTLKRIKESFVKCYIYLNF